MALEVRGVILVPFGPANEVVPSTSRVSKQIREQKLGSRRVIVKQHCPGGHRVSTKFAVETIVLAPKLAPRRLPQLGGPEKLLTNFAVAPQPTLGVVVATVKSPSEIFNFDDLAQ
jgi:hypothetical protein